MPVELIQRWWLWGFILLAILMYFFAYAGYRVQEDAKKRGLGKPAVTFWSISVVFFGPLFLPLYLMFRSRAVFAGRSQEDESKARFRLCPHCGTENPAGERVCRQCRRMMDSAPESVGKKICPYCGAENPVEARRCRVCDQVIGYAETDED